MTGMIPFMSKHPQFPLTNSYLHPDSAKKAKKTKEPESSSSTDFMIHPEKLAPKIDTSKYAAMSL